MSKLKKQELIPIVCGLFGIVIYQLLIGFGIIKMERNIVVAGSVAAGAYLIGYLVMRKSVK